MSSGIYQIENKINSKVYIGSSNNIKRRWQKHKALLRHNKHPNSHLQAAWNKYGEDNFIFSIIELCNIDSLLDREQYFINTRNPEYNQTLIAGKVEMTTDRRMKLSRSITQAYKDSRMQKAIKTIYQYDLKGNYIREYASLGEASNTLNIPISNLSSAGLRPFSGSLSFKSTTFSVVGCKPVFSSAHLTNSGSGSQGVLPK